MSSLFDEGCKRAIDILLSCSSDDGFLASPTEHDNYRRIWARDGVIIGLAALLTENDHLCNSFKNTLLTLARYQGPHGEIPSNVDPNSERVSFGGTTGRVDADLWFVIGCGEYWAATGDDDFLEHIFPAIEKTRFLLGAWEFNNRGLLYVPQAGDWADEYLHSGYVLYDQLLNLQVQHTFCALHHHIHGSTDHVLIEHMVRLKHLIQTNYWFHDGDELPDDIYHEVLYKKGRHAAPCCIGKYWMPFFSPTGYGYRFDAFANVLASLFDIATAKQQQDVDKFITDTVNPALPLLPAFHPVIEAVDKDWTELQMTFSYTFKNKPYEFHNGGLWAMITGFYVADLAKRGQTEQARQYLSAIHRANQLPMDNVDWAFAEYIHGKTLKSGGARQQGWSAAAALIGHYTIAGKGVFRIDGVH